MEGAALKWKHAATHITSVPTVFVCAMSNLDKEGTKPSTSFPFQFKTCNFFHVGNHERK